MFCSQCGKKLRKTDTFCSECGAPVKEVEQVNPVPVQNTQYNQNQSQNTQYNQYGEKQYVKGMENDTALCTLSLILMYGVPVLRIILGLISAIPVFGILVGIVNVLLGFAPIAAYALVIYARIHYKESSFAKILLIVYIVQLVIGLLTFVLLIVACAVLFNSSTELDMIIPYIFG